MRSLDTIPDDQPLVPASIIRVETLLSKQPIHRLSHHGSADIEIRDPDSGKVVWQVSHNSKFGEPGPLAYRIDTLVINRRIDEARCPDIPETIRLGTLREIADMCDMGGNTNSVKNALYQNASAFITAFLSHTDREKVTRTFEMAGTRYSLVFTGEHLPNGRKADAVYIILTRWYREMLNSVPARPLDYPYLTQLPPVSQRFYELVSFQIYAALKHGRPQARMRYSDFCTLAPQSRYFQYKRMHRQMNAVHEPHLKSGYLAAVEFQETTDRDGNPDWEMFYAPGPKARADYDAPTLRRIRRPRQYTLPLALPSKALEIKALEIKAMEVKAMETKPIPKEAPPPFPPVAAPADPATLALIEQLTAHGLGQKAAQHYAETKPDECRRQLDYLPYVGEIKSSVGAFLRKAIDEGYGPPKNYEEAKKAEAARAKAETRANTAKARQSHQEAFLGAYHDYLALGLHRLENEPTEAYNAFCAWEDKDRRFWRGGPLAAKEYARQRIAVYDEPEQRQKRFREYLVLLAKDKKPLPLGLLSFWDWDKQRNPERFQD